MLSEQIRQSFLDFFAARGHKVTAGSSLIPADPTTLFTSAGVQQFVPSFRGDVPAPAPRLATCQKCLRVDDIDEVGDAWHETFFEMLGNFSIGDYFKQEAIAWAWEYSIKQLGLSKDRLWITIHPQDEDAYTAWRNVGAAESRIIRLEDNWWPLSATWVGSCGPDSELYLDIGPEKGCSRVSCGPGCSCDRYNEYWNLVFPQFFQEAGGNRRPLEKPGVDTGLGMERLAALLQGKDNIFETDLFQPVIEQIFTRARELNPAFKPSKSEVERKATRIIADHSRAVAFCLGEGVLPSNEGRGYVVRKLLRRACYFGWKLAGVLGGDNKERSFERFITPVVSTIADKMAPIYPELKTNEKFILENVAAEEERFESALQRGFLELERVVGEIGQGVLPGDLIFKFYDTYGIPKELTAEIAAEKGLEIDEAGFQSAMKEQRDRSRAAGAQKFAVQTAGAYQPFVAKCSFVGYEQSEAEVKIIGILQKGESQQSISSGEAEVLLDHTPFYCEAGGQVGDTGRLEKADFLAEVLDTFSPMEKTVSHRVQVKKGSLSVGDKVKAIVDTERRQAISRAHTATHLLHFALRQVLGPHALQSGSRVEDDYLRFDFAHFEKPSAEQLAKIETEVNRLILANNPVQPRVTDLASARAEGAMALFGEKYGEEVRLVQIGEFSRELCGGLHLSFTAEVGLFVITAESSVGAGLRRIEALCGAKALAYLREKTARLDSVAEFLHCPEEELLPKLEALHQEIKQAQRHLASLQQKQAGELSNDLIAEAEKIGNISVIARQLPAMSADALRNLADSLVEKLGSALVVLAAEGEGTWPLVAKVSPDLLKKGFHAGKIVGEVAKIAGGGGGGRPDFAQAGAKDPARLPEALSQVKVIITRLLG
jgi:alanyl-tRNA synthetase